MKYVATTEEMRIIDSETIRNSQISGLILMEQAAAGCCREILNLISEKKKTINKIRIICGPGNNGGDGFAIARYLYFAGYLPILNIITEPEKIKGNAKINFEILCKLGIMPKQLNDGNIVAADFADSIIIDAIFGTGFRGGISGLTETVINKINNSNSFIIAIDSPSGLADENSEIRVKADITLAIGCYKDIFFNAENIKYTGVIKLINLHFPEKIIRENCGNIFVNEISRKMLQKLRPDAAANKGTAGKLCIIAGSEKYSGAAQICAGAAVESGPGLTYVLCVESVARLIKKNIPEAIVVTLDSGCQGTISNSEKNQSLIKKYLDLCDCSVIGPGIDISDDVIKIVKYFFSVNKRTSVIDADAINVIAGIGHDFFSSHNVNYIITPHPGEFSRIIDKSIRDIQNNRIAAVDLLLQKYKKNRNIIIVLKGSYTVPIRILNISI